MILLTEESTETTEPKVPSINKSVVLTPLVNLFPDLKSETLIFFPKFI